MTSAGAFSLPLESRETALETIGRYLSTGDETSVAIAVDSASGGAEGQCFAMMLSSGNGMTAFEKFLTIARLRKLVSKEEAVRFLLLAPSGGEG